MELKFSSITNSLRLTICLLVLAVASVANAENITVTTDSIDPLTAFLSSPSITPESTSIVITDLKSGIRLIDVNSDLSLIPASIMKTVTIASLISVEGHDKRFKTKVFTDGKIHNDELDGNIIITASGDPSLNYKSDEKIPDFCTEIAQALADQNISVIKGNIIIEEDIFDGPATPPSWADGDLCHAYGTGCHGFNFEGNRSGKVAVKNPCSIFCSKLKNILTRNNIAILEEESESGKRHLLLTHSSAPFHDIMRSCMMRSDNLYAEALQRTFSIARGKKGSTEAAAEAVTEYWKGKKMPMKGVKFIDGSGLSRSNRLTADFIDKLLIQMEDNVEFVSFFPLAGQEGTLKKFLADTPLDSYVALKTGSMNGIQSYAGYLLDDDFAPTHSIVVICNNLKNRTGMRTALSKLLLSIF